MSPPPPTTRPPVRFPAVADRSPRLRFRRVPQPVELPSANREVAPAADHRRRDRPYIQGLVAADALAAVLALSAALGVTKQAALTPASVLVVPLVLALVSVAGLYRRDEVLIRKTTLDEAPHLGAVAGIAALTV